MIEHDNNEDNVREFNQTEVLFKERENVIKC